MKSLSFSIVMMLLMQLLVACGSGDNKTDVAPPVDDVIEPVDKPLNSGPKAVIASSQKEDVRVGDSIQFRAGSTDGEGDISYLWSNGATTASTNITFEVEGTFTLSLRVTDEEGLTNTAQIQLQILAQTRLPRAVITGYSDLDLITGRLLELSGASSEDDGEIVSYLWSDGSTEQSFNASFHTAGQHIISLKVTDNDGLEHQTDITFSVTDPKINTPPRAVISGYSELDLTVGRVLELSGISSEDDDGKIVSYLWSDGSTEQSFNTKFLTTGKHVISLKVTDNDGLEHETDITFSVTAPQFKTPPRAVISGYSELDLTVGRVLELSGISSEDDDGKIVSYLWSDGSTATSFSKTFTTVGQHSISLKVTDNDGLVHEVDITFTVTDPNIKTAPRAVISGYSHLDLVVGSLLELSGASSEDDDGKIVSYLWSDGSTASNFSKTFTTVGQHSISLKVTDNDGLEHESDITFTVTGPLVKNFAQLHLRSSANAWLAEPMSLVADNVWQIEATFTGADNERLKFDLAGDWKQAWGDKDRDSIAASGKSNDDIYIYQGAGDYIITFNDANYHYSVSKIEQTVSFVPFIGPYLTLLSAKHDVNQQAQILDPQRSMVVNYETKYSHHDFVASAQYRVKGQAQWQQQSENSSGLRIHHIEITGLELATRYEYRVTGPNGQFSEIYHFDTASGDLDSIRFLIIGDMQDTGGIKDVQRWQDVAEGIAADHQSDYDFVILVGDMTNNDETPVCSDTQKQESPVKCSAAESDRYSWWKIFFDKGANIFAYKPLLPSLGNHDTPNGAGSSIYSSAFKKYFNINKNSHDYYSFNYGNAHFIALNSEIEAVGSQPQKDAQEAFTKAELVKGQQARWSFAYLHMPAVNPAKGDNREHVMYRYTNLFNNNGLDWLFTGHTHQYSRSKPLLATIDSNDSKKLNVDVKGAWSAPTSDSAVGYLICPPAGAQPYPQAIIRKEIVAFHPTYKGKLGKYSAEDAAEEHISREIGFVLVNIQADTFNVSTYGMGDVESSSRNNDFPGYNDDGKKWLMDSLTYSK